MINHRPPHHTVERVANSRIAADAGADAAVVCLCCYFSI
jgi:hypothetical protein